MAYRAMEFHEGEKRMHALTKVAMRDNPMNPGLTPRAAQQISMYPLMALGTIDQNDDDKPWCSLWGGEAPIAQQIAQGGIIGMRVTIDASFDPVANILLGQNGDGEVVKPSAQEKGKMVSALSINLEQRSRVKLYGRLMAGALNTDRDEQARSNDVSDGVSGSVQLVIRIEQSMGNCPKYLNKKVITSHVPKPRLVSTSIRLCDEAVDLIHQADMFFLSSSHDFEDMDANHRGGLPGFIRTQSPEEDSSKGSTIVWPEYSGNNLYQTLGNLITTPRAGLCIPNFSTGDVLYVTGDTEVLVGVEAHNVIAKSKLAVRLTVTGARMVKDGLGFRGKSVEDSALGRSPYNPRIRFLRNERMEDFAKDGKGQLNTNTAAALVQKIHLTPTITKYRFAISDPTVFGPWKPGQYVALDFSDELDMGYSHMRDDDPRSLNDDFLRTFTVSSPPKTLGVHGEEFEMIIRKVGSVTDWLHRQRAGMTEIGVNGFGGSFVFEVDQSATALFIAAGIGITPLLGQLGTVRNLLVRWTVGIQDIGLVFEVWKQCSEELRQNMTVFLTGKQEDVVRDEDKKLLQEILRTENKVERRRMVKDDLTSLEGFVSKWYLCTAPTMRKVIQAWIPDQSIIFENFDY